MAAGRVCQEKTKKTPKEKNREQFHAGTGLQDWETPALWEKGLSLRSQPVELASQSERKGGSDLP